MKRCAICGEELKSGVVCHKECIKNQEAKSGRLIDADALAMELLSITYLSCDGGYYKGRVDERDDTLQRIRNAPTIEPKRGEWLDFGGDFSTAECDQCEAIYEVSPEEKPCKKYFNAFRQSYKFCPNCGADMRKGE